jgi:hypothetical protein
MEPHHTDVGAGAASGTILKNDIGKPLAEPAVDRIESLVIAPIAVFDETISHAFDPAAHAGVVVQAEEVELVLFDDPADLTLHPLGGLGLVKSS